MKMFKVVLTGRFDQRYIIPETLVNELIVQLVKRGFQLTDWNEDYYFFEGSKSLVSISSIEFSSVRAIEHFVDWNEE